LASESPYTRHGRAVEGEQAPTRHQLNGSPRQNLLQIAHRELGEWRQWRSIAEENGMVDPLDLAGVEHADESRLVVPFELVDGSGQEDEDLTEELGPSIRVHGATPEMSGTGALTVTDTNLGEFELMLTAPDGSTAGAAVAISETDFEDVDGEPVSRRLVLTSKGDRYFVDLSIDIDLWLILWLMRDTPIYFDPTAARAELLVPELELE
jgi:hypothetical protein